MKEQKCINILLVISNIFIWFFLGFLLMFVFLVSKVNAEDYVLPTPTNICSDYTGSPSPPSSGTFCNKGGTTMWWDNPFYLDSYMSGLSGEAVIYNKSFIFNNLNLCKGKNVYIEYELGGVFGLFQRTLQYTTSIDGNNLVCNIELIDTSHVKLRCSGVGGSDLIIGVRMIDSITGGHYELGLSKKINAYCDVSNSDVIVNNKNDTQDIINNQNQNQQQTNEKLDDLNSSLTDDNVTGATNSASGFFNSFNVNNHGLTGIITSPLRLINSLTSKTCSYIRIPLPYVTSGTGKKKKTYFELPCFSDWYNDEFGVAFDIYQTIIFGLVSYKIIVNIFAIVKGFKNPNDDKIEVVDL